MSDIQNDFNNIPNTLDSASSTIENEENNKIHHEIKVDIIFCLDVTAGMGSFLDCLKSRVLNLYDDVVRELPDGFRMGRDFRAKIIAFRDYYADDEEYAMTESRFYDLTDPDDNLEFCEYVAGLKSGGGGDEPENALEALALAMKCLHEEGREVYSRNERARQIIVMCTDASAHPLEPDKLKELGKEKPDYYPKDMLESLAEMKEAWNGVSQNGMTADYTMNGKAKRLVLFTTNSYPWDEIGGASPWDCVSESSISAGKGGRELDTSTILNVLAGSVG